MGVSFRLGGDTCEKQLVKDDGLCKRELVSHRAILYGKGEIDLTVTHARLRPAHPEDDLAFD